MYVCICACVCVCVCVRFLKKNLLMVEREKEVNISK